MKAAPAKIAASKAFSLTFLMERFLLLPLILSKISFFSSLQKIIYPFSSSVKADSPFPYICFHPVLPIL